MTPVEVLPLLSVKVFVEWQNQLGGRKIDESVPHIAPVLMSEKKDKYPKVDGKIDEVERAIVLLLNGL